MRRQEAIQAILNVADPARDLLLFATGMISREAYGTRDVPTNFYIIGSMGLISSLALGMALAAPQRRVIAVDGDGSALMALGTLSMIGHEKPRNLFHIVLDNEAYGSTGNQPTISRDIALDEVARSVGYRHVLKVRETKEEVCQALSSLLHLDGPGFLLVKVDRSEVEGIGRVEPEPAQITARFRAAVGG